MKKTPTDRVEARQLIVQAANRHLLRRHAKRYWRVRGAFQVRLLNQRQIQRAVFVCRQNLLVDDELLHAAGFNGNRSQLPHDRANVA